ncbi:MAG: DNA polymerase III subunit alpha [Alphaproteobacteria bacterium]|nr:DNA polymerase III subunit alpha [Alphaproteobacteria bacterium]
MTTEPKFIHLRVHTEHSLLEGAIKTAKLIKWANEQKMPAIGMTDSGNIFGAMLLAKEASHNGIQPILGCQLLIKSPVQNPQAFQTEKPTFDKVVVFVQNKIGYQNLLLHFSEYYMAPDKQETPHLTFDELLSRTEGLIVLTGGVEGLLGRPVLAGHPEFAADILNRLAQAFPGRTYIELQRHGMPAEEQCEPDFLKLAYEHNIPLVATNEAFFMTPDMYEAHDAMLCIAEKTFVTEDNRRRVTPEHYLKTADQMAELFADIPEALQNTVEIAKRCAFMAENKKPAFPLYDCKGKTPAEVLREMAEKGFEMRMQGRSAEDRQKYHDRLVYELSVIEQMGFPSYFLIVADFIQWSKAHGVPVGPGRGSGAGSVVAWCLTITNIDPLRFNLLFERFLNPERVNMPDFDVDFCQENRQKTIEYVQNHYGFDHVAQIITFGKLQAKAVIRDVGRVLQIPYPVVDRLSKLVPNEIGITLKQAFEQEPEFEKEANADESIKQLLEIAVKLEGLYRNSSTHAAGVVIGDKPLDQIVPIYKDPSSDMPVTQYNMKFVESASLIKFDFLGLKTLTTIAKAEDLVRKRGIEINTENLPLDDEETFKLLKSGDTTGVFQLESTGMKKILHDMQPDKIEDVVALVSLYRPGPMDSIPSYIARKKGLEEPDYMHPLLEPILKETYGIMIYQEQVMQISQVMAGYSLGGADLLRRAMGKKIKEEMARQRGIFIEGALKNNIKQETAELVFDKMAKFAEYGFNKSHAAAYAYVAYQTAYLKAHYPAEFMAATMTLDKTNTDKLAFFKNDINKHGIEVLPPDINKSEVNFTVENGKVRYALSAIKNVGEGAMKVIVAERGKNGPFRSMEDFLKRVDVSALNKRYLENMARSGTFDCLDKNRAKLYMNVEKMIAFAGEATSSRNSAQFGLFGADPNVNRLKWMECSDWPHVERLEHEKEALGFYLSAHPLDSYDAVFERLRVVSSADIRDMVCLSGSARVQMAGIVSSVRERISQKSGKKFAFVTAGDKAGPFDMMCFSDTLAMSKEKLKSGQPLLLSISADKKPDDDEIRMSLNAVEYLSDVMAKTASTLIITVSKPEVVPDIQKILAADAPGKSSVYILAQVQGHEVEISLPNHYMLSPTTMTALQQLPDIDYKQV